MFKARSVCPTILDSPFLRRQKFLRALRRRVLSSASAGGVPAVPTDKLYVNGYDAAEDNWCKYGNPPPIIDDSDLYMACDAAVPCKGYDSAYSFDNASGWGGGAVHCYFECLTTYLGQGHRFEFWLDVGSGWVYVTTVTYNFSVWGWAYVDVSAVVDSLAKINACRLRLNSVTLGVNGRIYMRRCYLKGVFFV